MGLSDMPPFFDVTLRTLHADELKGMSREEVNARWSTMRAPFLQGAGQEADRKLEELAEVFHLGRGRRCQLVRSCSSN